MDYIEKLNLQTEEVEELENLEKHIITNSEPFSVDEYIGHTREFLAVGDEYEDEFNQLNETNGLGISCNVSKEVKEARKDVNGNIHEKLKDRIDSEVNVLNERIDNEVNDLNSSLDNITNTIVPIENFKRLPNETEDSARIKRALEFIGDSGVLTFSSGEYIIESSILITGEITLEFNNSTIIPKTNSTFKTNDNSRLIIKNVKFDFKNEHTTINTIYISKESEFIGENITFKNALFNNSTLYSFCGIYLEKGCKAVINNVIGNDIKIKGDTAINNNNYGRLIMSGTSDSEKDTYITINNVRGENCYNIDSNGNQIIDDFDLVAIQHIPNDKDICFISNVYMVNSSKRLIKLQSSNVSINNVIGVFNSDCTSLITCAYTSELKNININNVLLQNANTFLDLTRVSNGNINNFTINGIGTSSKQNVTITHYNNNNINISDFNIINVNHGLTVQGSTNKYIKYSNGNITANEKLLIIANSTADSGSDVLTNINVSNITFNTVNDFTSSPRIHMSKSGTNTIENININDCEFNCIHNSQTNIFYATGVKNLNINNTRFNFKCNANDQYMLIENCSKTVINSIVINPSTKGVIRIQGDSDITFYNCELNSDIIVGGTTAKIKFVNCTFGEIKYWMSSTSEQVTII